mgnify:CR=1 FL=1
MFRLFLLLHLLLFELSACGGLCNPCVQKVQSRVGFYNSCVQKVKDANAIVSATLSIPVKNNKRLIYSETPPNEKILKHDPFLGLYLVADRSGFAYDFHFASPDKMAYGVVNTKSMYQEKLLRPQIGLNSLGFFSKSHETPALVLNNCCYLVAIVTPNGVIQKEYLEHFLLDTPLIYGDIGIRIEERGGGAYVVASDPFVSGNPFLKGDKILTFDGKKVRNAAELMQKILFSKIGSKHSITLLRGSKSLCVDVQTQQRYGGGKLSDTFLESKGIYLDKKLTIVSLGKEFKKYGLLVGDRLLEVNREGVKTQEELRRYLENSKDYSSLLFERNNFQFFVNIK